MYWSLLLNSDSELEMRVRSKGDNYIIMDVQNLNCGHPCTRK